MSKYSKEQERLRQSASRHSTQSKERHPYVMRDKYEKMVGKRVTVYLRTLPPLTAVICKADLLGLHLTGNAVFPWIDITTIKEV